MITLDEYLKATTGRGEESWKEGVEAGKISQKRFDRVCRQYQKLAQGEYVFWPLAMLGPAWFFYHRMYLIGILFACWAVLSIPVLLGVILWWCGFDEMKIMAVLGWPYWKISLLLIMSSALAPRILWVWLQDKSRSNFEKGPLHWGGVFLITLMCYFSFIFLATAILDMNEEDMNEDIIGGLTLVSGLIGTFILVWYLRKTPATSKP